jgi:hypothetical protein
MNTDPLVVAERHRVDSFLDGLEIGTAVPVDVDTCHHGSCNIASYKCGHGNKHDDDSNESGHCGQIPYPKMEKLWNMIREPDE